MCTGGGKGIGSGQIKALEPLRDLAPHRWLGLPSLLDPILNPNDKYNKPKVPEITPAIERQAYKSPAPRDSIQDSYPRRRRMAGVGIETSVQGDTSQVSTTRLPVGGG